MSHPESIPPDPQSEGTPPPSAKPDWLVGAEESTRRDAQDVKVAEASIQRHGKASPHLKLVDTGDPEPAQKSPGDSAEKGPWKAAASSVPKLRQQPAAATQPEVGEAFTGFAQDTMMAKSAPGSAARGAELNDADEVDAAPMMPLAQDPPFWIQWIEQLQAVPRPLVIALGAVLVLGVAAYAFWPRETQGVALTQIRQRPEAYEGRSVRVAGKAGDAFAVGGSYVYNLYQGRDTIVVYTRQGPPRLNSRVNVAGTVSIGYLDGVPRVALLESPSTP